ncbi:hypothetical protein BCR33DRAFT_796274 [Rhizoclosmatium globosum]|uniref:Uncharacterized protein n=1 Tax=Rhizoclosmatium globosum TaxID=329046 RepID=A0A1Y2AMF9_9FUNG|nr:hypothetical protein BCR33DRAFT_796274 [Rhizoclosmatium globosum]|eukprot:ORY23758.1 hypothetical protein BCR33DRAFT_796274 [Rhizoclosmatium globosum]
MDSAAEMVVNRINNDSSVLPNTLINILRVESWDGRSGKTSGVPNGVGTGAPVGLTLATKYPEVIGALGETAGSRSKIFRHSVTK